MRRIRWLVTGIAAGFAGTLWVQRKARSLAARYSPTARAALAVNRARGLPGEVRAAITEGRQAMRQRETELRSVSVSGRGASVRRP